MRNRGLVVAVAAFVLLSVASAFAQRVAIRGKVTEAGTPIQGAEVQLYNKENGQKYTMKTDKKGEYMNIGIQYGVYDLTVLVNGQVRYKDGINMNGDQDRDIDLKKEAAAAQERAEKELTPEQRKALQDQRAKAEQEQNKVKNLNQMLAQAKQAEDSGNYDQAVTVLQQATQVDATQPVLWARLGSAYLSAGGKATGDQAKTDFTEAANAYQKALALKPTDGGYHNNLGQAYVKLGKTDDAIKEYNAAAQADPTNAAMYYFNLGAILTNNNKPDDAITAFDKALAVDPSRADAYYWKGVNLLAKATTKDNKMVAPEGTAEALNKYLELQPDGKYSSAAKELLASIGATVQTQYKKGKAK
jgi:tetratricopeptide (TPR) repeat protein